MEKATVYTSGTFGVIRQEVKLIEHGRNRYAQYENVPYAKYIVKGKRNPTGTQQSFRPFLLIVAGWDHMKPSDPFGPTDNSGPLPTKMTRYSSFDPRYKAEFNAAWARYVAANPSVKVIADYREPDERIDEPAAPVAAVTAPRGWESVDV